jgi:Protein of unknown function (DUF3179)
VYAREVEGQELTFGVSGKLIRNSLVMYDRESESLWSQILGESVSGDFLGAKLEFLPSWHTTWKAWKEMHPNTLALKKGFGSDRDPYVSYYQSSATGIIAETTVDNRLLAKEFVVGVELSDGSAKAYPFRFLSLEPVINDTIGDYEILIVFNNTSATGVVFDSRVGDMTLTFSQMSSEPFTMKDNETGSTWNAITGTATDGPLAGESLIRIKSTAAFWFGWKDFHPDTSIYDLEADPSS